MNNESEFTDEYVLKLQGQLEEKTYLYNKLQTESKYVINKQKEVLDKIKEYITTIDTDYAIGCWNKDEEFVDVKKDILELLEEIE